MARIIECPTFTDPRGTLTVMENVVGFTIQRLYWMTDLSGQARGQHRHKVTVQALICLQGSCEVLIKKQGVETNYTMDRSNHVLILEPEDWHELRDFKNNPVILVAASHPHDPNDYIKEPLA